jgi:hypothetical protein
LDFWQCHLLYFGTNLKEYHSDGRYEQLFFKYIPTHTIGFGKMCADDVCTGQGLNELTHVNKSREISLVKMPLHDHSVTR